MGRRSCTLPPEVHADCDDWRLFFSRRLILTWLIVLGRTQPKQITEVDRVTASEPVEVEPTRDANRVFSVERPASPHATPSQPRQKANTGRRRVTHCTRHLPDDGRPPGFQPLQKVEQPDGLPGAIALR